MKTETNVRPSPIAGRWYDDDSERLAAEVDGYLQNARLPELEGEVIGVMAPHAGLRYSGHVAGAAFAALLGKAPEVVAVVAPMHYAYPQPLITTAHTAYRTPLGEIPVDREALRSLMDLLESEADLRISPILHDPEHSLEIELPFLQRSLAAGFKLLPVMVRETRPQALRLFGECLAQALSGRQALLVASTDLSHFYTEKQANQLDEELLRRVESFDPRAVLSAENEGAGFACGRGAVAAVMWAARAMGASRAQVVRYATSGAVTGDFSQVVGYGAAVFTRPET